MLQRPQYDGYIHGQSVTARRKRLDKGCCPVHGIQMSQVSGWYTKFGGKLDGAEVTIVKCPRKDCQIHAYAMSDEGPYELLSEHLYLFREDNSTQETGRCNG